MMLSELKITIQSLNDIITNSSTEIITTLSSNAEKTLISVVNEVLKIAGSRDSFDDLFTLETHWDGENNWEEYEYNCKEDYIKELEANDGNIGSNSCGKYYVVKSKDPKNKNAADLLNDLQSLTTSFETYG